MFERFKNRRDDDRGAVATAPRRERVAEDDRGRADERGRTDERRPTRGRERADVGRTEVGTRTTGADAAREVRARQREEFGGINWGSAFFGWLVAVGMAAILLGLLSAAGAAFGLGEVSESEASNNAETIGIVGAVLLIIVLMAAYYFGGYVSGRMSRFDGARQGLGVWAIGLTVTVVLAVAGALFGAEYNVLERLNLPRIPVEEGTLTAGAAIALAIVVIGTLVAALVGGKSGERYHKRVDRVGYRI